MRKKSTYMQPRSVPSRTFAPSKQKRPSSSKDDLTRIFNAALLSSRSQKNRDFFSELSELKDAPAFQVILNAVRQLASVQGIEEREAALEVIATFRKLDEIWGQYLFCEGLDRLTKPNS